MTADKRFASPVLVKLDQDGATAIANARDAAECLLMKWPAEPRGPMHRDAVDACLKVLDGHRSTIDAQHAFIDAAREASILVGDDAPRDHLKRRA